jgi:hypothetical protein
MSGPTPEEHHDWDIETLTEQIWSDLEGECARSMIREILGEVVPKYDHARVQTFVPIFIRRDAVTRLCSSPFTDKPGSPSGSGKHQVGSERATSEDKGQLTRLSPAPDEARLLPNANPSLEEHLPRYRSFDA